MSSETGVNPSLSTVWDRVVKLDLRWVEGGTERRAKEAGRTRAHEFHS